MTHQAAQPQGWSQATLIPPEHVRIEVVFHWDATEGSKQLGLKVTDHLTDEYLAIKSIPLPKFTAPNELAIIVAGLLVDEFQEHCFPF